MLRLLSSHMVLFAASLPRVTEKSRRTRGGCSGMPTNPITPPSTSGCSPSSPCV